MILLDHVCFRNYDEEKKYILVPYFEAFYELMWRDFRSKPLAQTGHTSLWYKLQIADSQTQIAICDLIIKDGYDKIFKGSVGDQSLLFKKLADFESHLLFQLNKLTYKKPTTDRRPNGR